MLGLPVQFFLVVTSRFAFQDDGVRHDVDRYAALDNADVRGGLVVDSTELHLRDALGRHFDGADSFFRANSRVSFEALNVKLHTVGGKRFSLMILRTSQIIATPLLSSPPSTVLPSVCKISPSSIGTTPSPGATVSIWAESRRGRAKGVFPGK